MECLLNRLDVCVQGDHLFLGKGAYPNVVLARDDDTAALKGVSLLQGNIPCYSAGPFAIGRSRLAVVAIGGHPYFRRRQGAIRRINPFTVLAVTFTPVCPVTGACTVFCQVFPLDFHAVGIVDDLHRGGTGITPFHFLYHEQNGSVAGTVVPYVEEGVLVAWVVSRIDSHYVIVISS